MSISKVIFVGIIYAVLTTGACAPQQRMGMVVDPNTGLQYGSIIEKNIVIDSSQFENNKIKVRTRNTSGDQAFDLHTFIGQLKSSYESKGYVVTEGNDYGMLIDVNVTYSGQASQNMSSQFGFLGAAAGGLGGAARSNNQLLAATTGIIAGATLGSIIGSYVTEDTYIIVANVSLGIVEPKQGKKETTIVFSSSKKKTKKEDTGFKSFRQRISTGISVFAGGRNTPQSEITEGVRQRFTRIISDVI
jgi:hypothetical protein